MTQDAQKKAQQIGQNGKTMVKKRNVCHVSYYKVAFPGDQMCSDYRSANDVVSLPKCDVDYPQPK